jgi:plastocyanin
MTKLAATLSACLALGLVTAGCGSDDDEGGSEPAKTSEEKQPAGGAKTVEVSMKDIEFNPKDANVSKGGTVKWTNNDSFGHDVTASSFKSGGAGGIKPGGTFEHTFDTASTFSYRCTVHPGMNGTVVVK